MMRDFELWLNTRFLFGRDVHKKAGSVLRQMGVSRVLIHHDSGAYLYDTGLLESVRRDLEDNGMAVRELPGVKPNPRLDLVYEGIRCVKENQIDFILAIGGGSVIDSSKAIGAGALYDGDVWDFFTKGIRVSQSVPVGVILTCPATGSESGDVSVINNTRTGQKLLTSSQALRPVLAFMNPELTVSLPASVTACSVADMFSHVCERYFTPDDEIGVIDRMAEGILKTLVEIGPALIKDPHNYGYRAQVMWISAPIQRETKMFLGADNKETAKLTVPMYDFGDWASRMKAYRKKNHITQQELAQLMGVKHFTLRSWEQKQTKPPYHVWRLHKHLFDNSIKLT